MVVRSRSFEAVSRASVGTPSVSRWMVSRLLPCAVVFAATAGCNSDETVLAAKVGPAPESVAVAGGPIVSGFATGVLRTNVTLSGFRITKYPITISDYAACQHAGACSASDGRSCSDEAAGGLGGRSIDDPKSPQTCLTVNEATNYCRWVGGRLPTLPEWLLAARGSTPHQYAWGDAPPSCSQHPRAGDGPVGSEYLGGEGCVAPSESKLVVGEHRDGAAPSGVQDVLLTPGELLASQADAQFSACDAKVAACFVFGLSPGAIDAVYPVLTSSAPTGDVERLPHVYGFRCVLGEG